jgi:hypothetical protein
VVWLPYQIVTERENSHMKSPGSGSNSSDYYGSYGNYAEEASEWYREQQYHIECVFPDTGFAVSWCRICEKPGRYSFRLGKYINEETSKW